MPEGDTIARAARTLHAALAGHRITSCRSVVPALAAGAAEALVGQTVERAEARGKHLLLWLSGGHVLRTHMRMHGSWHLYRPGERWRRPASDMRLVIGTEAFEAVAFAVPVIELLATADVDRAEPLRSLGPDLLAPNVDVAAIALRLMERTDDDIATALLDQHLLAGIGNVYKSEALFVARVHPFIHARQLSVERAQRLVTVAVRLLRANTDAASRARSTTGWHSRGTRLWVYDRAGLACRVCGAAIASRTHGPHARTTYWCPRCQPT